ncbi:MAG: peptide-methionine (S)-S-oxide reductase MsrA [Gammaproteobacteria bacterium]|nr:peptide-methionine (S)-S-oxide reductase MsrA [Gammaproteobacteria bacterium]
MSPPEQPIEQQDASHVAPPSTDATDTNAQTALALFAGGCFWCMEPPFDEIPGVLETLSGYAGGTTTNPSYQEVTRGGTGHLEVMQVRYDPNMVSYEQLLEVYWRNVDFLDDSGQFCDRGASYVPAIFALTDEQKQLAESSRVTLKALFPGLNTPVRDAHTFYRAEEYHQDYYQKNALRYKYYRWACKRDARLQELAEQRENLEKGPPPAPVAAD